MPYMALLFLWVVIEIALFVVIGGEIGLLWTLLWILGTGVVGVVLLRSQAARGASMLSRGGMMRMPEGNVTAGIFRAFAAIFLIMPGFLSDAIGILLLLPPVQMLSSAWVMRRFMMVAERSQTMNSQSGFTRGSARGADVVDGEWEDVSSDSRARRPETGWSAGYIEDAKVVDDNQETEIKKP